MFRASTSRARPRPSWPATRRSSTSKGSHMADDVLAGFSVQRVAGWYRRLGNFYARANPDLEKSLAAEFLLRWLDNRNPKTVQTFEPPRHLKSSAAVFAVQRYHRNVFMT